MERAEKITDERGDLIVEIGDKYLIKEVTTEMSRDDWQMFITIKKQEEEDYETGIHRKSTARRRYIGCRAKQRTRSDRFNQQTGGD